MMYKIRTRGHDKRDPLKRWALPDRVFLACGACHILAFAVLDRYGTPDMTALWIKPAAGQSGHHIVVASPAWIFDYDGYCARSRYLEHVLTKARRWWPGWDAVLLPLPTEVLVSEATSRCYEALWLREPKQFRFDAVPRARAYLDRFAAPGDCLS